ncbi:MAG: DNA ligase [Myxococcota bacterium]
MTRYEFSDGKSHKFWEIERVGTEVTTRWGRIGTDGQSKTKSFPTEAAAEAGLIKQTAGKVKKGYAKAGATLSVASPPVPASSGDLGDGESVEVPGSGGRTYILRNVGGVYSCTCPAWRNQSVPIERRTCKHLRRFRGDDAETQRLGELPAPSTAKAEGPPLLLAQSWDPSVHDPTGWWMSEKLDGVRALWDGKRFVSRLGKEFLAPGWFTEALPDQPLDGELFGGRGQFQRTVGVVRRIDRGEAWQELRFLVFDGPKLPGAFEERLEALQGLANPWPEHLSIVQHVRCESADALTAEMDRIERLGGEGLMLRKPGSAYVAGRSETLLKVKRFLEVEARVIAHVPGAGRHKGRMGALRVELPDGTPFKVGTGFTDAERAAPPPVGVWVTVRYQELTKAGVPRFPSFLRIRSDVDP